jgi:hypothetical protein
MKTASINVSRIDKTALVDGKNGKYLSLVFFENRDGEDRFGNMGFITQDLGKERRLAGEKGPILGNWREMKAKPESKPEKNHPADVGGEDDIPF